MHLLIPFAAPLAEAGRQAAATLALPNLRWGPMQLRSEKQPPELTLQVFVLEVQP